MFAFRRCIDATFNTACTKHTWNGLFIIMSHCLNTIYGVIHLQNVKLNSPTVIYNSIWSILINWIRLWLWGKKCDQVHTKESVLPVWDKPYHTNKNSTERGAVWNFADLCIGLW